jgi:hypothetical protein
MRQGPNFHRNIFKKWHIFSRHITTVVGPRLTTQSPQLHHKNTTQKTHFSQNPLQKRPQKQQKSPFPASPKKI